MLVHSSKIEKCKLISFENTEAIWQTFKFHLQVKHSMWGFPAHPTGHLQTGLCVMVSHSALLPHGPYGTRQGSWHWPSRQASSLGHSVSERHPLTTTKGKLFNYWGQKNGQKKGWLTWLALSVWISGHATWTSACRPMILDAAGSKGAAWIFCGTRVDASSVSASLRAGAFII